MSSTFHSYANLRTRAETTYKKAPLFGVVIVILTLIPALLLKFQLLPASLPCNPADPSFIAFRLLLRLGFFSMATVVLTQAVKNDKRLITDVIKGLEIEASYGASTYFQDVVKNFEGNKLLILWTTNVLPLVLLAFQITLSAKLFCANLDSVTQTVINIICGFSLAAWAIFLHRTRYIPFKVLVAKKQSLFPDAQSQTD